MKGCRGGAQNAINGKQKHCLDSKMSYCVEEPCVGVGVKNWKEREIWGHCDVTPSLCPLSMEDRERVSFDSILLIFLT